MMGKKGPEMSSEITEDRLLALIAAYGADPLQWPASERIAAQQLAATGTPAIRQALAEAHALDQILATAAIPSLSESAITALKADAKPGIVIRMRALFDWWGPIWQPTSALAAALLLGVMLGLANPDTSAALADMTGQAAATDTTEAASPFDAFLLGSEDSL
ncbi:MAG: hypothetical protein P1V34_04270 [Alphaproteobacteria bacterium]|nr:hypothetical protein [Alphaproteobacteria bacterium]